MTKSKILFMKPAEWLVIFFIIAVLFALIYPVIQEFKKDGPYGKLIPESAPREENRVTHASGISFIPPPNWVRIRDLGPETPWIYNTPRGRGRSRAALTISKVGFDNEGRPPDQKELQKYKQIKFQGYPAYERMINTRDEALDNPYISVYDLYVDRDGEWWHVEYWVAGTLTKFPAMVREYINAIRFPPKVDEEKEVPKIPETEKE